MQHISSRFTRLLASLWAALLIACAAVAQQPSPGLDARWHRTYPAGPYSEVGTAFGGLYTTVPLFDVKGPGDTSLSMALLHVSNQQQNPYGYLNFDPGIGWHHTLEQSVTFGAIGSDGQGELQEIIGNVDIEARWTYTLTNNVLAFARRPGVRADAAPIMQNGLTIGFTITNQATRDQYIYDIPIPAGFAGYPAPQYQLDYIKDPHGNKVTFSYDSTHTQLLSVTDASNKRFVTFTYQPGGQQQLIGATLNYPSGSLTWNFDMDPDIANLLLDIRFPAPDSLHAQPKVFFRYDGQMNIDRVLDPHGGLWAYSYGKVTNLGGAICCTGVWKPYCPPQPNSMATAIHGVSGTAGGPITITLATPLTIPSGGILVISGCAVPLANGVWQVNPVNGSTTNTYQLVGSTYTGGSTYWFGSASQPYYDGYTPEDQNPPVYNGATLFNWSISSDQGYRTCTITEPSGGAQDPTLQGNVGKYTQRTLKHVYYNGGTEWNNYAWLECPIYQIVDAPVAADSNTEYTETYVWNASDGTIASHTDRRGKKTTFHYIATNRGLMDWQFDPAGYYHYYQYSIYDKVITASDPTTVAPGSSSNVLTNVAIVRTMYTYDPNTYDLLQTIIDPITDWNTGPNHTGYYKPSGIGLVTTRTYNSDSTKGPLGELSSESVGSDTPTTYSNWDAYGNAKTVTNPLLKSTTYTFDNLNHKLSEAPPAPLGQTTYTYDNAGRLTHRATPTGSYNYTYDMGGDPNGQSQIYNAINGLLFSGGHSESETKSDFSGTYTWFDARNRPYLVVRQNEYQYFQANTLAQMQGLYYTGYYYNEADNQTAVRDRMGRITQNSYDERNHRVEVSYPDKTSRSSHFDGNGNLDTTENGRNVFTYFVHDSLNRLTVKTYNRPKPDGTLSGPSAVTCTYTPYGAVLTSVDHNGTRMWDYDAAHELVDCYQPLPNKSVYYTYYSGSGRKKSMTIGNGSPVASPVSLQTWSYDYDGAYRLWHVYQTIGAANPATYQYYDCSLPKQIAYNQTGSNPTPYCSLSYDGSGHPIETDYYLASATTPVQTISASCDFEGRLTSYKSIVAGKTIASNGYSCDQAERMIVESGLYQGYTSYYYDLCDNQALYSSNATTNSLVDGNNKWLGRNKENIYDNDGNLTTDGDLPNSPTLVYDPDSQLTSITSKSGRSTFQYDGDGRRIEKVDTNGNVTRFVYDGETVIADTDGSGSILNLYLPGVGFIDPSGNQYFYRANPAGSNVGTTDPNCNLLTETEYSAYGMEEPYQTSAVYPRTSFRYGGKAGYAGDNDPSSRLVLLGHRFYDPMIGRFITQDRKGHEQGLNLYEYCADAPLGSLDPTGNVIIRVISYFVAGLWGFGGWHRGILVEDNMGHGGSYSFAGGPENYGIIMCGALVSKSGPWSGNTQDFWWWHQRNTELRRCITLVDDTSSYKDWITKFKGIEAYIAKQDPRGYPSFGLPSDTSIDNSDATANSNTWCHYLLENLGLMDQYDHAIHKLGGHDLQWAPGWDIATPFEPKGQ